jgi:glucoamylase
MPTNATLAPGKPGQPGLWTTGAKTGVGAALGAESSVWFTLSHGIVTEIYYPFVDTACTRDLELLVTDRKDFFSEEKRDTTSEVQYLAPGVPAYQLTNTCKQGRYRIEKTILADPHRSALLMQVHFEPLQGKLEDYAVFVLLSPHLGNQAAGNSGWVSDFKGVPLLLAQRGDAALALGCTVGWLKRSAGYVGVSDGWQDISRHKQMAWTYERAEDGNVALTGEVDLRAGGGAFLLALGLGRGPGEAGHRARAGLLQPFDEARTAFVHRWNNWHKGLLDLPGSTKHSQDLYRISGAIMRCHESKHFPGGIIASLSIPWGDVEGDQELGYHRVWPRDMIETVQGQLAIRQHEDARRVLFYLQITQEPDGHWPQNMLVDGRPSWGGIQLDETAFVILLVGFAEREKALAKEAVDRLWPMVRQAASYLVRNGPVTPMDRWEEESGYFPSTMAVEIPALLIAADLADKHGEPSAADYLRQTADAWNDMIEELVYVRGTELARQVGVDGYYVRFAKPDQLMADRPAAGWVDLKNHRPGEGRIELENLVSPDALCLVRFGLRAADDPRIVNTVRVIDQTLKVETPHGPCWHRYTKDGYGEHADGSPFDGTGIGRIWPLLTGERAHYELAAGRKEEAERLLAAMELFASDSGLFPEQIWDSADLPDKELYFGRPTGSAMPLVWAHAEYVRLRRSLHDGRVFDLPLPSVERYLQKKTQAPHVCWRFDQPRRALPAGKKLRLELTAPARVRWSADNWRTSAEVQTWNTNLGVHIADLPTEKLRDGAEVVFTFHWSEDDRREGRNFHTIVERSEQGQKH